MPRFRAHFKPITPDSPLAHIALTIEASDIGTATVMADDVIAMIERGTAAMFETDELTELEG